jgi:hypothetical protein
MRNRKEVVMEGKDDLVSSLKCYLLRSFHSTEWSSFYWITLARLERNGYLKRKGSLSAVRLTWDSILN